MIALSELLWCFIYFRKKKDLEAFFGRKQKSDMIDEEEAPEESSVILIKNEPEPNDDSKIDWVITF